MHDRWLVRIAFLSALLLTATVGCAHHRADQYSYAPPYAPPVYPQPQAAPMAQSVAQPVAYAMPGVGMPAGAMPAGVLPAGSMPAGAVMAGSAPGEVIVASGGPCPDCGPSGNGMVIGASGMIEGGGQTPPCPPGQ
ncbi:MAG: hypothetical protein WCQ77_14130 [Planctomycetota bacterium]